MKQQSEQARFLKSHEVDGWWSLLNSFSGMGGTFAGLFDVPCLFKTKDIGPSCSVLALTVHICQLLHSLNSIEKWLFMEPYIKPQSTFVKKWCCNFYEVVFHRIVFSLIFRLCLRWPAFSCHYGTFANSLARLSRVNLKVRTKMVHTFHVGITFLFIEASFRTHLWNIDQLSSCTQ